MSCSIGITWLLKTCRICPCLSYWTSLRRVINPQFRLNLTKEMWVSKKLCWQSTTKSRSWLWTRTLRPPSLRFPLRCWKALVWCRLNLKRRYLLSLTKTCFSQPIKISYRQTPSAAQRDWSTLIWLRIKSFTWLNHPAFFHPKYWIPILPNFCMRSLNGAKNFQNCRVVKDPKRRITTREFSRKKFLPQK